MTVTYVHADTPYRNIINFFLKWRIYWFLTDVLTWESMRLVFIFLFTFYIFKKYKCLKYNTAQSYFLLEFLELQILQEEVGLIYVHCWKSVDKM